MPVPDSEAEALRRCLAILAPHAEPHERAIMASRTDQQISGEATGRLAYSFRHVALLFYPSDSAKARAFESTLAAARKSNELASLLPPEQGRITLSDLAAWPSCPPLPQDSPLTYWLPGKPIEKPSPAPAQQLIQNVVMVDAIMRHKFPLANKLKAAVSVTSLSSRTMGSSTTPSPEYLARVADERKRLESLNHAALSAEHSAVMEEIAARAKLEAEAREAAHPFNQQSAMADFAYWATMGHWQLDESVALLLGRDPTKVSWNLVAPYVRISDFAKRYERLRNVALRAPELGFGQHASRPMDVIAWAADIGQEPPIQLSLAIAAREAKRLKKEVERLQPSAPGLRLLDTTDSNVSASSDVHRDDEAPMRWGYVMENLRTTPGHRAAMLLEYLTSIEAKAGGQHPSVVTLDGREFEVNEDLLGKLELLPNIDAALVDATNPRKSERPEPNEKPAAVTHRLKRRADALATFIDAAKTAAGQSADWAGIWAAMVKIAQSENRPPPVLGYVEGEGVKYQTDRLDDPVAWLTRDAWRKRFERAQ